MKVTILGGAGEYGRSCFLLEIAEKKVLIDCGVLKSGETIEEQYPNFTNELAQQVQAVFLTHAHEDHSAALPYFKNCGFSGEVFATQETISQVHYFFEEWRKKQLEKFGVVPYSVEDENLQFTALPKTPLQEISLDRLVSGLTMIYGKTGHIVGAVWFLFRYNGKKIFFSGDYSLESKLLAYDFPIEKVDYAVIDGAYGVEVKHQDDYCREIIEEIFDAIDKRQTVVLPVPAYGRAQDILFLLEKAKLIQLVSVSSQVVSAGYAYLEAREWIKSERFHDYQQVVKQLAGKENDHEKPLVYLWSETELLENDHWFGNKSKLKMIVTGPMSQCFSEKIQQLGTEITKVTIRYKVHPAIYETETLLKQLEPKRVTITHSPPFVSQPLAKQLAGHADRNWVVE